MTDRSVDAIVLAAGEGSRMKSALPKPLHLLGGRPMVFYVLEALHDAGVRHAVVVVGYRSTDVINAIVPEVPDGLTVSYVNQFERRGTGDATAVGLVGLDCEGESLPNDVLVVPGDAPLVRAETLSMLIECHHDRGDAATVLSTVMDDPTGYGRVVRDGNGRVTGIVEQLELSAEQLGIHEVGTSIYCFHRELLASSLQELSPTNSKGEYYLTDVVAILADEGHSVGVVGVDDPSEVAGINNQAQLECAETTLANRALSQ